MAGAIYHDVAHGKPLLISGKHDACISRTVDLLWQYKFSWLIVDRWTDEPIEVLEQGDSEHNPLTLIELSADGDTFTAAPVNEVVGCSEKGSRGTHRSLQLIFPHEVSGRYIRISYQSSSWTYSIRAGLKPSQIVSMESATNIERMPVPNQRMMLQNSLKAAVIGGSNSVMRHGWVKGLASGGIKVCDNVALGSSSNAILASRLSGITSPNLDVLFVNSTVNEYIPTRDRAYDLDLSRQFVRHIQSWCAEHKVLPVFLIYPQRRVLDDIAAGRNHFDQESYCIEMCEDLQIPYINVFALTRQLSESWQRPLPSLYRDEAHLNHPTAQVLGSAIAARVWRLMRTNRHQIERRVSDKHLTHDFQVVPLSDYVSDEMGSVGADISIRRVKTSIVDQEMVTIRGQARLIVPIPDGWEVIGYTINARRCNTSIQISGENTVQRRADFAGYKGEDGFPFVCSRSLITPVLPSQGNVQISCTLPTVEQEPDEITNKDLELIPQDQMEIELSEVIIREKARRKTYARVSGISLDLTVSTSLDFAIR